MRRHFLVQRDRARRGDAEKAQHGQEGEGEGGGRAGAVLAEACQDAVDLALREIDAGRQLPVRVSLVLRPGARRYVPDQRQRLSCPQPAPINKSVA